MLLLIMMMKVIRLHMSHAERLLSTDPDLKLIHVVRDPRGLLEAWKRVTPNRRSRSVAQMKLNAKLICRRMTTDCELRRRLELKYPHRTLLVHYEDLVTATDTVLADVYGRLLQLPLPNNLVGVIAAQMQATSDNGALGTLRANGSATATRWRQTIDSQLLEYMTDTCRHLLAELNYTS